MGGPCDVSWSLYVVLRNDLRPLNYVTSASSIFGVVHCVLSRRIQGKGLYSKLKAKLWGNRKLYKFTWLNDFSSVFDLHQS